jgi:hypothetical protein
MGLEVTPQLAYDKCSKSRLESFWDAFGTLVFLGGAIAIDTITKAAFPDGMSFGVAVVLLLSELAFGAYSLRMFLDELGCCAGSVGEIIHQMKRVTELLAAKNRPVAKPAPIQTKGRQGKKGRR